MNRPIPRRGRFGHHPAAVAVRRRREVVRTLRMLRWDTRHLEVEERLRHAAGR